MLTKIVNYKTWISFSFNCLHAVVLSLTDSTRALYEKKLREAMVEHRRTQLQSDRTYYREEEGNPYTKHEYL